MDVKHPIFFVHDSVVVTIDSGSAREILEEAVGPTVSQRATHIIPANCVKRFFFRLIRRITGDGKHLLPLERWTRRWRGPHLADLRPSGGRIAGPFYNREKAIAFEVQWLHNNL